MPKLIIVGSSPLLTLMAARIEEKKSKLKGLVVQNLQSKEILENKYYVQNEDVIICGESIYEAFKENGVRGKIVPIRVQSNDFIRALIKARQYGDEVNIVNYKRNYLPYTNADLEKLFQVTIHQYTYHDREEAETIIDEFEENGKNIVLGAGLITNLARQRGLTGIELYGKESVHVALDTAFNIIEVRLEEISNSKRQQYILENFNNGVLIVSDSGSILNINNRAVQFLGLGEIRNITGAHVRDLFKESALTEVLLSTKEIKDKIITYQSTKLFLNAFPIIADQHYSGLVVIFSDVDDLQQKENKIRRTIYNDSMRANYKFADIIGQSAAIRKVIDKTKRFARSDSNILILGESGTGKELFAQSIHNESRRDIQPFIAVNCAAVPENLLESEFFGYVEGAFTGARKGGKPGLFEQAHNGTVFLDEIGEIPLSMQSKLLRVLQENVVMRVGSSNTIPVNVRIISATNVDLIEKVKKGTFRMDLYYRIAVLNVFLPPLRHRLDDIEGLVLNYTSRNYPEYAAPIRSVIQEMVHILSTQKWHGNIRELENTLERMFAYLESPRAGTELEILTNLQEAVEENHLSLVHEFHDHETTYRDAIRVAEINKIKEALREANGNKIEAAKILGMSRSTLWRKLNEMKSQEL